MQVDIMNGNNFCPGFTFVRTANHKDRNSGTDMHSDVAMYATSDLPENHEDSDDEDPNDDDKSEREDGEPCEETQPNFLCDWFRMHILVEFKRKASYDPYRSKFSEADDALENPSGDSTKSRGQMLTYAGLQLAHQWRNFAFGVGIYDSWARLYCFDSSSTVVSARFNIHKQPRLLVEFFLRYAILTQAQRGFDPTATPATKEEKTLFHSQVQDYISRVKAEKLRMYPGIENIAKSRVPIFKVQVNDGNEGLRWYLVRRPDSSILNFVPCGRFTRGFIAVPTSADLAAGVQDGGNQDEGNQDEGNQDEVNQDEGNQDEVNQDGVNQDGSRDQVGKGKLYWLKDYWRPENSESESSLYAHLKDSGVPNLPEVICGGDVYFGDDIQQTTNDSLATARWVRPVFMVRRMVHHRIVQELLIPLSCIEDEKSLLRVGRDIMECKH